MTCTMTRGRTTQAAVVVVALLLSALLLFYVTQQPFSDQTLKPQKILALLEESVQRDRALQNDQQQLPELLKKYVDESISEIMKKQKEPSNRTDINRMGVLFARDAKDWTPLNCDRNRKLRQVSLKTQIGNLTFYIYDSASSDHTVTATALRGEMFERHEIEKFLTVSKDLPLIDVGANVGLVTLQAAMQGRQVVSVEPIPENALRLCRSALDFGHAHLVHVINNAVSSSEGVVTMASPDTAMSTRFEVRSSSNWGRDSIDRYAIHLDRLLEVIPFKRAALKIDVESHEGHVISGAHRLFQEVDIPLVWMEWEHVKKKKEFGAKVVIDFMSKNGLAPHNLMSGGRLNADNYMKWPFSVLWKKVDFPTVQSA